MQKTHIPKKQEIPKPTISNLFEVSPDTAQVPTINIENVPKTQLTEITNENTSEATNENTTEKTEIITENIQEKTEIIDDDNITASTDNPIRKSQKSKNSKPAPNPGSPIPKLVITFPSIQNHTSGSNTSTPRSGNSTPKGRKEES